MAYFPLVSPNFVATVPASFARDWEIYVRPRGGSESEEVQVYGDEKGATKLSQPLFTGPAGRIGEGSQFGWVKGADLPVDLWGRPKGRTDAQWQVLPEGDQAIVAGGASAGAVEEVQGELKDGGKGFVAHGSDASTPRPAAFASVEWQGTVAPENAVGGDTWLDTSSEEE